MVMRRFSAAGTLVMVALFATLVIAPEARAQVRMGFTAGPAISKLSGEEVDGSTAQWGVFLGLNVEYELSRDWQLDLELALSQKGGDKVSVEGGSYDYRMDYFEIPLTLSRLFWLSDGQWAVSPFAGVSVGLKTKCALRPAGERAIEFEDCTATTPGGDTPGTFYGLPIGVALRRRYPGGSSFGMEARYIAALNQGEGDGQFMAKSNTLTVMMSFTFPLDTKSHGTPAAPNQ